MTTIVGIVGLLAGWVVSGYFARTVRLSPGSEGPPTFDIYGELFVDGAKIFFACLVYMIVPLVLIFLGLLSFLPVILSIILQGGSITSPPDLVFSGIGSVLILVGLVLGLIFAIILGVGIAHMIKTRKFGKAFAFKEIFRIIGGIGWLRYIGWLILIGIIAIVILGAAGSIPFVGWIVSTVVSPIVGVFFSRSLGLLYNDGAPAELRIAAPVVREGLVCTSCGTPLQPYQKFCPRCGTLAPAPPTPSQAGASGTKFCINCDAKILAGVKFCGSCGTKQP